MSLLIILSLQFPSCQEIKPMVNMALLKMLKYDGQGIPDLVYCETK